MLPFTRMQHVRKWGLAVTLFVSFLAACSAIPTHPIGAQGSGGQGGTTDSNKGNGGAGHGGGLVLSGNLVTGGGTGGGPSCGGHRSKAEVVPLDLYLMLDSSGSMLETVGTSSTTKWTAITAALSAFLSDPGSVGLGVGLQHFPQTQPGVPDACAADSECPGTSGPCMLRFCEDQSGPCSRNSECHGTACVPLGQCGSSYCLRIGVMCDNGSVCSRLTQSVCYNADSCAASDYAKPEVEFTLLGGPTPLLDAAIASLSPNGSTPTVAAVGGAIQHAKDWASAHPTHTVIVVLATDGLPTECSVQDIPSIAKIAAAGLAGSPSIKTFAIGTFAKANIQSGAPANLDQIANAGGTQKAFLVNTSENDVEQAFLDALTAIRGTKLACEFVVPSANGAGALDFGKVNMEYTTQGAAEGATIPYTTGPSGCDPVKGGWYYDGDPGQGKTPTRLIVCPATCATFSQDSHGEVDIQVGCKTVAAAPPK